MGHAPTQMRAQRQLSRNLTPRNGATIAPSTLTAAGAIWRPKTARRRKRERGRGRVRGALPLHRCLVLLAVASVVPAQAAIAMGPPSAAASARPERIVSLDLCTD